MSDCERRATGARWASYACTSHFNRGENVCGNLVQAPIVDVDRAVIGAIGNLLTPDLVDEVIAKTRELLEPDRGQASVLDRLLEQIDATEQQAANLADAIAMGGTFLRS